MMIEPRPNTLVDLLRWRATQTPDQIAYTFLVDGEAQATSLTYAELEQWARAIAADLQQRGATGARALLLYPAGLAYIAGFFGCLYAGVVAVPLYPPRSRGLDERIARISQDAQAQFALTTGKIADKAQQNLAESPALAPLQWLVTDQLVPASGHLWQMPALTNTSLAYLQYTSGSTALPKGVMVSHGNLLYNLAVMAQSLAHESADCMVSWLPLYHDMGLIFGILYPLYQAMPAVFFSSTAFVERPYRWLHAISRYKATHSIAPNFAYDLCVTQLSPEQRATLDLSRWRYALNGAEPIQPTTLETFAKTFAPCGFAPVALSPGYGLAEATLAVTLHPETALPTLRRFQVAALQQNHAIVTDEAVDGRLLVGCGHTALDTKVIIVNPETLTPCAADEIGEIWISGPTVAQGYWQNAAATQATFRATLAATGQGPFLRTGDLGFLQAGELFITGRLKDLIILRGRNHYPQDIELTVQSSHAACRPGWGAAFSIPRNDDGRHAAAEQEQLVIVQELERTALPSLKGEEVLWAIRRAIGEEHGLHPHAIVLTKPGSIPKTSSGKIQRRACRERFLQQQLTIVAQWQSEVAQSEVAQSEVGGAPAAREPHAVEVSHARAQAMVAWLRTYAATRINSRLMDERRSMPPYLVLDLGNQGFLGLQVPEAYGGMNLLHQDALWIYEQVAALDLTLASFLAVHNALGIRPLLTFATPEQRAALLPPLATGRALAAFALTEPGAGSHPHALAATATPIDEQHWQLQGQKSWIGNGSWAGVTNLFVQLLDSAQQPLGITGFVLDQENTPLPQGPEALTLGLRAMVQNTIYLDGVTVAAHQRLGKAGEGMLVAQDTMMFTRLVIAAMSVGAMKRCAQLMLRYAQRRTVATGRLLENPATITRLNELTAAITVVEAYVKQLAQLLDAGQAVPDEAYIVCKTAGPEFLGEAADALIQLLGGRGYIETNGAPQLWRDARVLRILEGPTEPLTLFLGSRAYNKSEVIEQFMAQTLGAPTVAHQLQDAIGQLKNTFLARQSPTAELPFSSPFADPLFTNRWLYLVTGELVTLSMLWAALAGNAKPLDPEAADHGVRWIRTRFAQKLEQIQRHPATARLRTQHDLTRWIEGYTARIGDLEQQLPGEAHEMDPLLRQQQTRPRQPASAQASETTDALLNGPSQATPAVPQAQPQGDEAGPVRTVAAIQSWLIQWLSTRLPTAAGKIKPTAVFADYGLDSVMALELLAGLDAWLQEPLAMEPTLFWNYPTISALAVYLAHRAGQPNAQPPTPAAPELAADVSRFSALSDSEMAHLLAQEIQASRARRQHE